MTTPSTLWVELELPHDPRLNFLQPKSDQKIVAVSQIKLRNAKVRVTQNDLVRLYFSNWKPGNFAQSFPELNAEAADFGGLELDDAKGRLQFRAAAEGNSVSVLGLAIPLYQITRWGALVLLGTQVYFWLHLHELVSRIKPDADGLNVAWIGIYRTRTAFFVALLSACIVPTVAGICLGTTIVASHYYGALVGLTASFVIIAASALLGALTAGRLRILRAQPW